jgi:hypothetical protein
MSFFVAQAQAHAQAQLQAQAHAHAQALMAQVNFVYLMFTVEHPDDFLL